MVEEIDIPNYTESIPLETQEHSQFGWLMH